MKKNELFLEFESCVPKRKNETIDWTKLMQTGLQPFFEKMSATLQNPIFHGEGDVGVHTKLVCEKLVEQTEYWQFEDEEKTILFLGALFHDVGKIPTTKLVEGEWTSRRHSIVGATMTREFLWKEWGLCGGERERNIRESVCNLVRYHSFPPFAIKTENAERRLLAIASNGELATGFSIEKLCLLERADVLGRVAYDQAEYLERIDYCKDLAKEIGCLYEPYKFVSNYAKRAYFLGRTDWKDQNLYKDTWGEVVLTSGLPASGKDTWIKTHYADLPMISLDEIRKELGVLPTEDQTKVVVTAHERAKELLRKKQPFVWNATSITAQLRSKQITLFENYNASVKTLFLETDWQEELARNNQRKEKVPQNVIEKMLSKLELPERAESETVVWELT